MAAGAVPAAADWLKAHGPSMGSGAVAAALEFLIEVAGEPAAGTTGADSDGGRGRSGSVATLQQAAVPETATAIVQAFCGGSGGEGRADAGEAGLAERHANPRVMGAICELYERMARHDPAVAAQLVEGKQVGSELVGGHDTALRGTT